MVEINRKLATIRKIAEIRPIEGADKIEAAKVDDWWIIIQKNKHNVGELILFFEIDSFLPVEEKYEFLRKSSFKSTKNLGDGFRIKSMKMKGQISQGLIFPLEDFSPEIRKMGDLYEEGQDFTEILKIQKYENPISANLAGIARGNFPSFIPKTDQERYQNLRKRDLEKYLNMPFEVTLKMDGTSMTVYKNEDDFGICSRNMNLKDESENIYWKMSHKYNFKEILTNISRNLALQGELCGPGIQKNPQQLSEHEFFLFDVYDIDNQRYFTPRERHSFIAEIYEEYKILIKTVPVWFYNRDLSNYLLNSDYIHKLADDSIFINKDKYIPAEGLVFKADDGNFSFKIISNRYLLSEKD